ncbi:SIMPL domain-containing protein [uncultured Paracoccus sp.]|uniref:SIMPL domain-containing protein n=1 Tax=uncultured Paracoccus sp. TaxID=189685 RepID=UPI00260900F9|nr:SIMPL domain-containing protein [uncultured Paracoccus sp.]
MKTRDTAAATRPVLTRKARGRGMLAGLLAGAALMAAAPAMAAPGDKPGMGGHHACHGKGMGHHGARISVTGEGQALGQPDMATINLGVTTQAETAAAAMTANSEQQTAVIAALTGSGVEERDIQTSGLNLTPMMDYSREGQPPRVTGYQAQNMVTVRVRDLAGLGGTLDGLVTAGANEINGITFGRDNSDEMQDEARRDAVADAQHRAEVIAEAAGLTLGPVLTMRDVVYSQGGPEPMMMRQAMDAGAAKAVPVQGGELTMMAQVEMQFALRDEAAMAECAAMGPGQGEHDAAPEAGPGAEPAPEGEMPAGEMPEGEAPEAEAPDAEAAPSN